MKLLNTTPNKWGNRDMGHLIREVERVAIKQCTFSKSLYNNLKTNIC